MDRFRTWYWVWDVGLSPAPRRRRWLGGGGGWVLFVWHLCQQVLLFDLQFMDFICESFIFLKDENELFYSLVWIFLLKKKKRNPFFIQYLLYENITFYIGLRYHVTLWKSCWKIFHLKSISMNKNSKFLLKQIYSSNFTRFFFSWHWMIVKLFLTSKYINIKEIISIYHFSDFNVKI